MKCGLSEKCGNYDANAYSCNYSQDYSGRCYKDKKRENMSKAIVVLIIGLLVCANILLWYHPTQQKEIKEIIVQNENRNLTEEHEIIIILAEKFSALHPANPELNYQCLQIAREFKGYMEHFGFYGNIELGCKYANYTICHAWLYYDGIEVFGSRKAYPIYLTKNQENEVLKK